MTEFIKKFWVPILILVVPLIFFWQFFLRGLLPIPSDTIVGLYHPFRDFYSEDYSRGIPFKNFIISDPVRQIIPWKELSIDLLSNLELPLWNPYEMAGKPLLANFQSSPFYPLNLILFIKPFNIFWSIFILIQPILAGAFMFAYLRNLKLDPRASILGSITFAFSGFSIAWLEWGNIGHTVLWLPLILLSIDKIASSSMYKVLSIKNIWAWVFLLSIVFSFFAGHLQTFFYLYALSIVYFFFRWFEQGKKFNILLSYLILNTLFFILTAVQWIPTLQFINLSARSQDQNYLDIEGWFIPLQHLVQFVIPDFFGNPTTLNYWGTWNYGELVGYVGVITLAFVIFALISGFNRTKLFFANTIITSLLFATDNPIARIPFELNIPFVSSVQPTRLIFLVSLGLSVLSAIGFDTFLKLVKIKQKILLSSGILLGVMCLVWLVELSNIFGVSQENLSVLRRNLYFPSAVLGIGLILIILYVQIKNLKVKKFFWILIVILVSVDLLRFGWKFMPFTNSEYFYPQTRVIEFLQKDKDLFRIASTDSRILPPNFPTHYKIQSIEGYDPLYLLSYAQLIAASERDDHSIREPFGFNRIITPHNMNSKIIDYLNVKYVLSLSDLESEKLTKVFQEGDTRVYENKKASARAFFVESIIESKDNGKTISGMFSQDLSRVAYVEKDEDKKDTFSVGEVRVINYSENKIELETENSGEGFLVLTDSYYPTWRAQIDGRQTTIYKTNHAFRGVIVPSGKHMVVFKNSLF